MKLQAFITVVAADMTGREKMMRLKGNRAYSYCNYCKIRGVHNRAIYCPIDPPMDAPQDKILPEWKSYNRLDLPMRNDREHREDAEYIERMDHDRARDITGIAGESVLSNLKGIDFPRSFPPDSMHLFSENVVPDMCKLYRGVFFKAQKEKSQGIPQPVRMPEEENNNPDNLDDEDVFSDTDRSQMDGENDREPGDLPESTQVSGTKRKKGNKQQQQKQRASKRARPAIQAMPTAPVDGPTAAPGPAPAQSSKKEKFKNTQEPWNIKKAIWEQIGLDQKASAKTVPGAFGRAPRDFSKHCHHFSGEEWKMQSTMFLPIYLKDRLPDVDYQAFCDLTRTIELATETTITDADIENIKTRFAAFNKYYEDRFYARKWDTLQACLPVIHQLLHVHDGLRWIGPMHVYAQWAMERMCGSMTRTAKSRVSANRNMEITLLLTEQKYALSYRLALEDWNGSLEDAARQERMRESEWRERRGQNDNDDDDHDDNNEGEFDMLGLERTVGNINLAAVFEDRISEGRPPISATPAPAVLQGNTLLCNSKYRMCYKLINMVEAPTTISPTEVQRIRGFLTMLKGYDELSHSNIRVPFGIGGIHKYRWCNFRDLLGNRKRDFKVTSRDFKMDHNTRNASLIEWVEPTDPEDFSDAQGAGAVRMRYKECYGEVLYFFTAALPEELGLPDDIVAPDEDDDGTGIKLQALAFVRKIPTEIIDSLLKRSRTGGALAVIHVKWIRDLIGLVKSGGDEFIIKRWHTLS